MGQVTLCCLVEEIVFYVKSLEPVYKVTDIGVHLSEYTFIVITSYTCFCYISLHSFQTSLPREFKVNRCR